MSFPLPDNLPVPLDDGGCDHLVQGTPLPSIQLQSTNGELVDPSKLKGLTVIYCYPMTGKPGQALPEGWDLIPGARGCTPQSCGFKDHFKELKALGVNNLYGLSTQDTNHQKEVVERLHLPFQILSDESFAFVNEMKLPTFEAKEVGRLVKRVTLILKEGKVAKVFYPVFPPDKSAEQVVEWLKAEEGSR